MEEEINMESPTIAKLAEALSKAQGAMQNAAKDKDNPFFKSTYADLASVWDACREPLSKNGLSIIQPLSIDSNGKIILTTKMIHSSGEWVSSLVQVTPVKADPQGVGSAITYMRRFSLSALVGIAPAEKATEYDVDDDDDGNAASGKVIIPKPINFIKKVTTPDPIQSYEAERLKLQKEMVDFVNQKNIDARVLKEHLRSEFSVESAKLLNHEQLKQFVNWLKDLTAPGEEKEIEISQEFESAVAETADPRVGK